MGASRSRTGGRVDDEIELEDAWINLAYSENQNRMFPDLNPASPGRPYFVDLDGAASGQWVRVVFRTAGQTTFWCVGVLARWELPATIHVDGIGYENGDPAPRWFVETRWKARFELQPDGNWSLAEIEEA